MYNTPQKGWSSKTKGFYYSYCSYCSYIHTYMYEVDTRSQKGSTCAGALINTDSILTHPASPSAREI